DRCRAFHRHSARPASGRPANVHNCNEAGPDRLPREEEYVGETTRTAGQMVGFVKGFTRYQWMVFLVVWLGWTLDGTDFGLFSLVLKPALTELLGGNPTIGDIGRVGGLISMASLLGWAVGGFVFGVID